MLDKIQILGWFTQVYGFLNEQPDNEFTKDKILERARAELPKKLFKEFAQQFYWMIFANKSGLPVMEVMEQLGKDKCLELCVRNVLKLLNKEPGSMALPQKIDWKDQARKFLEPLGYAKDKKKVADLACKLRDNMVHGMEHIHNQVKGLSLDDDCLLWQIGQVKHWSLEEEENPFHIESAPNGK